MCPQVSTTLENCLSPPGSPLYQTNFLETHIYKIMTLILVREREKRGNMGPFITEAIRTGCLLGSSTWTNSDLPSDMTLPLVIPDFHPNFLTTVLSLWHFFPFTIYLLLSSSSKGKTEERKHSMPSPWPLWLVKTETLVDWEKAATACGPSYLM